MKNIFLLLTLLVSSSLLFTSCDKDDETTPTEETPTLEVPTTYNFENVSYSGQQSRLAQFGELKSYMGTSKTSGVALDSDKLLAMYANEEGAGFSQPYTKNMRSKTFAAVAEDFDALLVELAQASTSTVAGSEGVSGVIESLDGAKSYLIGEDGLDHAQIFEKSLMGALLYYQATSVYMGEGKMDVDNTTVTPGEGTDMEHHWDEAFGYFGSPIDFPSNTDGIVFWANYANKREAVLGNSQALMNALLKGRAAISQNQIDKRDEAISEARKEWELVSVTSALHYLNVGINKFEDKAIALHGLSEAVGFIYSLQFNEAKVVSNEQISGMLTELVGSDRFENMNLYNTTVEDITAVKADLAAAYGLTDRADEF